MNPPTPFHTAIDTMPFKSTVYQKTGTTSWFLMKSPSLSDTEQSIINGLGSFNDVLFSATSAPMIA